MSTWKTAVACTLAASLMIGQLEPVAAAPMPTNVATIKAMAPDGATQVHWHGGWGWGWGAGALAGAIIGGAIASGAYYGGPYYGYYPPPAYYGYGPYYGYPRYYRPYGYSYGYYRPYRVYRRHHHRRYW